MKQSVEQLKATAQIIRQDIVEMVVRDGPNRIRELMEIGARFTKRMVNNIEELDLGKEGGHSKRRIVHAQDMTGREIEDALLKAVDAEKNIIVYENHIAVDLITHSKFIGKIDKDICLGAYVLDKKTGEVRTFLAKGTILSTGGAGKVYLFTSNPDIATGDGIAMAYRAGATIANMEFIQFHPTCLYHSKAKSFLISEAVRGEGGILRLKDGTPFMANYHPMKDLAPRDNVARAIDFELKKRGEVKDINDLVMFRTFLGSVGIMLFQKRFVPELESGLNIDEEIDALLDILLNGIIIKEKVVNS